MEKEINQKAPRATFSKKLSLFKRRKKADIRPFVKESKNRKFKKTILNLFLIMGMVFLFCFIFWAIRFWALPMILKSQNSAILSPVNKNLSKESILKDLEISGLEIENIEIANDLTLVTFKIHKQTLVIIDPRKGVISSLKILRDINSQIIEVNKKAVYVDLRYNKPIVKME